MSAPGPPARPAPLDEVLADYMQRVDRGEAVDRAQVLAAYPELAEDLQSYFEDSDAVERFRRGAGCAAPEPPPPAPAAPRRVGDYELLEEIARGGMGVIYRARQLSLQRLVAVKMILPGRLAAAGEVQRFRAEAAAAANLDHPNVVPIYEVGEHQGQHYFSMKLVEGGSLTQHLPRLARRPRSGVRLLATVARAVHYAHQRGLLHRDLKPANILVDAAGQPHVTDFGLAKRLEGDAGLTQPGMIVGTPNYMAPEQASNKGGLSTAADVYSLGAILYELLTGRPPFRETTPLATLVQVLERDPTRPRALNPRADRDLETVCRKCLEKEPAKRYDSAAALADELRRWLDGEPVLARPAGPALRAWKWARRRPALATLAALLAAVALAGSAGVGWQWQRAENQRQAAQTAERDTYFHAIGLAHAQWQADNAGPAARLLAEQPERLRGWEWRYLRRLFQARQRATLQHVCPVLGVAYSPDGRRLASAGADGTVRVWERDGGQQVLVLRGHEGEARAVAFSPDGRRLASGGADGTVRVWDLAGGREVFTLRRHAAGVTGVAFSPDGARLVSAGGGPGRGELRLWDAAGGGLLRAFDHTDPITGVAFSPDGTRLALALSDAIVTVRDAATLAGGADLQETEASLVATARWAGVAYSADGRRLAAVSSDGALRVWAAGRAQDQFTPLSTRLLSEKAFTGLAFQPVDDKGPARGYLAVADTSGTITLRFPSTWEAAEPLRGHAGPVTAVAFSPDGRELASASRDQTLRLWDVSRPNNDLTLGTNAGPAIVAVAFSPDGTRLVSAGQDQRVRAWDLGTGGVVLTLKGHKAAINGVCLSPDGSLIASAGEDETVRLWDADGGRQTATLSGHTGSVRAVAFAPRGGPLASAGDDGTVRLWDAAAARQVACLRGHDGAVAAACFGPDGARLASAGADGTVRVWDVAAGRELFRLAAHAGGAWAVAFSPDGRRLASAGQDWAVRVWDAATGAPVPRLGRHAGPVRGVAFSPDGRRLASAGDDQAVRLWDGERDREVLTLRGHAAAVRGLAFSPDGHRLASAGADGAVKVWDATPLDRDVPAD